MIMACCIWPIKQLKKIYIEPIIHGLTDRPQNTIVVVVVLLFYVHGKHLRSCRDGQLT